MCSFLLIHVYGFFFNFFSATSDVIELLPRYVLEEGFKSAIFGSYSYDPLSDVFQQNQGHETQQSDTTKTTEATTEETTTESKNDTLFKMRHIVRRYSVKSKCVPTVDLYKGCHLYLFHRQQDVYVHVFGNGNLR